jgi:hypothetical protein
MKPSLQTLYGASLTPYLNSAGVVNPSNYMKVLSALHTSATHSSISSLKPKKALGTRPPEVNPQDSQLPRIHRTNLRQLRSSYCKHLRSYQNFIGASDDDRCPDCHLLPHSSNQIFMCPSNPTDLTARDLWKRPRESAEFLRSTSSFSHLPIVTPSLPRPPPEPPPAGAGGPQAPRHARSRGRSANGGRARRNLLTTG